MFGIVTCVFSICFCQAEDGIRALVRSRGLGDVYKRQILVDLLVDGVVIGVGATLTLGTGLLLALGMAISTCLLYTSDAADDLLCVDLGGRRII